MIGVIIIGTMGNDNIGFEFTDLGNNLIAVFKGRHQLAVVIIQNDVLDSAYG